ncbi:CBS domain-containing protein [Nonomuraea sp. NPDC050310]|uniref:CBS domain-containing protein n=1 Tax=Nonomuraea sp. NPDC050310 TaxID=3154935 RepID=UPI0033C9E03D
MSIVEQSAERVMSRILVVVKPEESPMMAWEIMHRAGIRHLPVMENGRLIGILSRDDVLASWYGGPEVQARRQVRALLHGRRMPRAQTGDPLSRIAQLMLDTETDAVPVFAGDGRVAGLVTSTDVLTAVAGRLPAERAPSEVVTGMFHLEPVLPAAGG